MKAYVYKPELDAEYLDNAFIDAAKFVQMIIFGGLQLSYFMTSLEILTACFKKNCVTA